MESYLDNRTQIVSVTNNSSETGNVTFGVPQGSVLGPLLVLIFINDLPLVLSDKVSSTDRYADDTYVSPFMSGVSKTGCCLIRRTRKI